MKTKKVFTIPQIKEISKFKLEYRKAIQKVIGEFFTNYYVWYVFACTSCGRRHATDDIPSICVCKHGMTNKFLKSGVMPTGQMEYKGMVALACKKCDNIFSGTFCMFCPTPTDMKEIEIKDDRR